MRNISGARANMLLTVRRYHPQHASAWLLVLSLHYNLTLGLITHNNETDPQELHSTSAP